MQEFRHQSDVLGNRTIKIDCEYGDAQRPKLFGSFPNFQNLLGGALQIAGNVWNGFPPLCSTLKTSSCWIISLTNQNKPVTQRVDHKFGAGAG